MFRSKRLVGLLLVDLLVVTPAAARADAGTPLMFVLSIVLEWPFCAWAMRGERDARATHPWRRSFGVSTVTQTASYALLVPFYLLVSPISIHTAAQIQRSLSSVKRPLATVYYLNPDDGDVWHIETNGTGKRRVLGAHVHDPRARLSVIGEEAGKSCLTGLARASTPGTQDKSERWAEVAGGCVPSWLRVRKGTSSRAR